MAQEQTLGQSEKKTTSPFARAVLEAKTRHLDPLLEYGEENAAMFGVGGGDLHHPLAQEVDNDK